MLQCLAALRVCAPVQRWSGRGTDCACAPSDRFSRPMTAAFPTDAFTPSIIRVACLCAEASHRRNSPSAPRDLPHPCQHPATTASCRSACVRRACAARCARFRSTRRCLTTWTTRAPATRRPPTTPRRTRTYMRPVFILHLCLFSCLLPSDLFFFLPFGHFAERKPSWIFKSCSAPPTVPSVPTCPILF
jgi:hypothetical protein